MQHRVAGGELRERFVIALLALGCLELGALGCVEQVELDPVEVAPALRGSLPPVAEFDPGQRVVPLPNALLMDPATGRVNVPPGCGEQPGSAAARLRAALNQLDGFGTSRASLAATFTEPVDPESAAEHAFLVRIAERGMPLQRFEGPVPVVAVQGSSERFAADCSASELVPNLTLLPGAPLEGSSTYAVVLLRGLESESGAQFQPSATWALVRQADPPVVFSDPEAELPDYNATVFDPRVPEELASLRGLDLLWRGHAPLLAALDALGPALAPEGALERDDVLLAWAFDTQTLGDPLDPTLPGSAANQLSEGAAPLVLPAPLAGDEGPLPIEAFFASAIPGVPCELLGCAAIGAIYTKSPLSQAPSFTSSSFLQGDDCSLPGALAGSFDDPVAPRKVCERQLPLLIVLPRAPAPAAGFPTLIFAHGLGRSKEDVLAIAGSLASGGIASVALDAVDHGVRAARVSLDAALGCEGPGPGNSCEASIDPGCAPQCFAPILSDDLARTRDHLRQTVLDQLTLEAVLEGCSEPGACGALHVDAARIGYLGQSLGALIGGVSVALSPTMRAAALNVGAADWLQVLMDTGTPALRCPLVDALIGAGVIQGSAWNLGANADATCLGDAWKTQRRFLEFAAAARWILDPVDAINYADRYGAGSGRSVLLAEVVGDAVIPNSATFTFGTALGLAPEMAMPGVPDSREPSPAVLGPGSHWVRYPGLPADEPFPGNAYAHGSLLAPAEPADGMAPGSGELGTLRLQLDTLGFFATHLGGGE